MTSFLSAIPGVISLTSIPDLAASHKEGGPMTAKYLKSLEKDKEGLYYLPYEKYSGDILRSFLAIETRLREFAEVDHN